MKTAVDYIKEKLMCNEYWYENMTFDQIIEQAKEMEKGKHQETWDVAHQAGRFEGKGIAEENFFKFEEYWEETFKSE
jgi:hypothetical protein